MHSFNYNELSLALKVQAPLLMLDRLIVDAEARTATGVKCTSMNEVVYQGHFPVQAVTPGVMQVAAMEQSSRMLFDELFPGDGVAVAVSLRKVKFRNPVLPGMVLHLQCSLKEELEEGRVEFFVENKLDNGSVASSGYITLQRQDGQSWYNPEPVLCRSSVLPEGAELITAKTIMEYIPHRYPFMLIDGAYSLDIGNVIGFKNVTGNDLLVNASGAACFPGFLQVEAAAQLGCAAMLSQPENKGKLGFFMSIDTAEFRRPVLPGEQLALRIHCDPHGKFGVANGEFYVGDILATKTEIKFALVDAEL